MLPHKRSKGPDSGDQFVRFIGEGVGDGDRRPALDAARDNATSFELTETLGEHPEGHTGDLRCELDGSPSPIEKAD